MRESTRRRMRVSLLTALLALTCAALAAGLFAARRDNARLSAAFAPLEAENAKLRAEQGALSVDDPSKIYAIQLPEQGRGVWRYRVFLPKGHRYYLAGQANRLPVGGGKPHYRGPPPGIGSVSLGQTKEGGFPTASGCSSGEFLVTVTLGRTDRGEKYFDAKMRPITEDRGGATIGTTIASEPDEWPAVERRERRRGEPPIGQFTTGIDSARQSQLAAESGSFVLFERRYMHGAVTSSADSDEGVIVWIGVVTGNGP